MYDPDPVCETLGTYPKSPISMISDKKSIGNEVVFSKTLPRTGSERCTRLFPVPLYVKRSIESFSLELQNCSKRLRTSRTSSEVFRKLRICWCCLQKSWYSPVKNLMPLTQKKLAGIESRKNTRYFFYRQCAG